MSRRYYNDCSTVKLTVTVVVIAFCYSKTVLLGVDKHGNLLQFEGCDAITYIQSSVTCRLSLSKTKSCNKEKNTLVIRYSLLQWDNKNLVPTFPPVKRLLGRKFDYHLSIVCFAKKIIRSINLSITNRL